MAGTKAIERAKTTKGEPDAADPIAFALPAGEAAAALADLLAKGDVLYAAADDARAAAVAAALAAMMPDAVVAFCPGSDALPGDAAPASPVNVGQRVAALRHLRASGEATKPPRRACITTGEALARAYPPAAAFAVEPPTVAVGDAADGPALLAELQDLGYVTDERVDEPGEVAWRGQVLDVFPADTAQPVRIEIVGGRMIALHHYDPVDQRTVDTIERQELGRVTEPEAGKAPVPLPDHLPDAVIVVEPAADERRQRFLALVAELAKRPGKRGARDIVDDAAWQALLEEREQASLRRAGDPPPRFVETQRPLHGFVAFAEEAIAAGEHVVLMGAERDLRFLSRKIAAALHRGVEPGADWAHLARGKRAAKTDPVRTLPVAIDRGFRRPGLAVIAAADLIGSRAERGDGGSHAHAPVFEVGEIRIGDVVVHEDHGLGIVAGLESLTEGDGGDAIRLTFAHDAVRLVPVAEADRLWRYGAEADAVHLDTLDGASWTKRRGDIDKAVAETARALTDLAQAREGTKAPVYSPDAAAYERFAAGFPFSETADQARAIAAVRADLASGRPMDRLVVGDVGYGKTEVAMRATALVALAGGQVALAAPTTVLARQHLESFAKRFEGTGVAVAGLSRLSSAAEKKRVKAGLADGSIGVVVGTGAVAGKGVAYENLGLVIVDEEQRFGAADKGKLRDLSAGHVLQMSATPIPRTLQAALVGLQQLSIIATPPARRQPIRTAVAAFDDEAVRAALLRERSRGGQSFVVVPRIEDMAALAERLGKLVPELELLQAHGKMPAAEIDEAMVRFGHGDGDVLLATNIIEAGLDVPRANTMVIWRADRFGLSQLHQLRGRVGRGNRRGQVLLLTDPDHPIAPRTLKRLRTLEAFDRLGAGFDISARDLDMRGAGDLLGETQAGHMKLIGVDLYQRLLEGALRTARGETVDHWSPELHLGIAGCIPDTWVAEEEMRVTLYARLARIEDTDALDAFAEELEDRFGPPPAAAQTLFAIARLRRLACTLGIARIDAGPAAIALTPHGEAGAALRSLALEEAKGRFLLRERIEDPEERLARLSELLERAQA